MRRRRRRGFLNERIELRPSERAREVRDTGARFHPLRRALADVVDQEGARGEIGEEACGIRSSRKAAEGVRHAAPVRLGLEAAQEP